jgi:tetratricopeptide (TPR) repeat protein
MLVCDVTDTGGAGAVTVPADAPSTSDGDLDPTAESRIGAVGRLPRGTVVGRYVVLDVLGTGAAGVVYAAYDPELLRNVALKLLGTQTPARVEPVDRAARIRMLREAQAMARLTHRNVVAVYDVGDDGEHLYIAMELVRGTNLRRWLGGRARPWREVLPVLAAAGRGLAAAHAHGLVHRDFKPENVLIAAADARVCVSDFGLARPGTATAELDDVGARSSGVLDVTLTVEGDALGTPAYMAPEQHRGAAADARIDVYAFGVVLFEALYGARPFGGDDPDAIVEAKLGAPVEPRAFARDGRRRWPVPTWLRTALRRALAQDPADRWPTMDALLAELERAPARRRRLVAAAAAVGAIASIAVAMRWGAAPAPCEGAGRTPAGWDESTRAQILAAFERPESSSGATLGAWAAASIDRNAAQWADVHRELCEATWVRGEQSPELLDVRMACLQRAWADVEASLALLRDGDAEVVARAPALVGELPDPGECRSTDGVIPSSVPREQWSALGDALASADALHRAGREREAAAVLDEHIPAARALGEPRLLAEMLATRGDLEDELGHPEEAQALLLEALALAKGAADARLEAEIWLGLAYVQGYTRHRFDEGRFYGAMSLAAIAALGGDVRLESWADTVLGAIAFVAGDDAVARRHFDSALALRRAQLGDEHPLVASALNNLGGVLYAMDDLAGAEAMLGEALAMRERLFGPDHAVVAESAINLGLVHVAAERGPQALAVVERALAIQRAVHGDDHPDVGRAHDAMANACMLVDEPARALVHADEAVRIYGAAYGEGHPTLQGVLLHRGRALVRLGRRDEAIATLERLQSLLVDVEDEARREEAAVALAEARAL